MPSRQCVPIRKIWDKRREQPYPNSLCKTFDQIIFLLSMIGVCVTTLSTRLFKTSWTTVRVCQIRLFPIARKREGGQTQGVFEL